MNVERQRVVLMTGSALGIGAVAPQMMKQGWGRMINMSSISEQISRPGLALHGAKKAALEQLTHS